MFEAYRTKTKYGLIGEPFGKRTKAHVGNTIEIVAKNSYKIPIGSIGTVLRMTNTKKSDWRTKYSDWYYKVQFDGYSKWIVASTNWETIRK